jgi:hypothetical protein
MEQHAQRYLAEKPGAPDQEDLSIPVDFSWRKLHNLTKPSTDYADSV